MARPSTISQLPEKVRAKITVLRDQGRTIDDIMVHLEKLDVEVSRSALGRHLKKQQLVAERIRRSRQLAEAVGREFGDDDTSKVARTNIELLHSLLMKVMIGDEDDVDGEVILDTKEAMFAATAIEKLSKASKLDIDRELKVREEERRFAKEKAAAAAVKVAKKAGLTADTVNKIKSEILGVDL